MSIVITEPPERSNPYLDKVTLVLGDITEQQVDAIVTLLPQNLEYRGHINQALISKSGEQLDEFILQNIMPPKPGDVYPVPGFNLPCEHIFFVVVPVWRTEFDRQDKYLINATRKSIEMAQQMGVSTIAIPAIGSGKNGFAKPRAVRMIVQGIIDRLDESTSEVRIVCHDERTQDIFRERLSLFGWQG